jgi:RibD C-terminal domain
VQRQVLYGDVTNSRAGASRVWEAACPIPPVMQCPQQYLKAGFVDEMQIHVANVLLGAGRPLFANIGDKPIKLERTRVIATPAVTHLQYRIVK